MSAEQKSSSSPARRRESASDLVKAYRDRNYRVVANSRSIKPSSDPDILTVAGDVADPDTAQRIVSEAIERFGRIDTLVNNAGIFVAKPFVDYTAEDYARWSRSTLRGFFDITQLRGGDNAEAGLGPRRHDHDQPGRHPMSSVAVGARVADQGRHRTPPQDRWRSNTPARASG